MLLRLDFQSEVPIYQQIRNQVVLGIGRGTLAAGARLPTIRALAEEPGVNMMTVSRAYQLLKQEGYITTDRRSGAVVSFRTAGAEPPSAAVEGLRLHLCELRLTGVSREEALTLCARLYDGPAEDGPEEWAGEKGGA